MKKSYRPLFIFLALAMLIAGPSVWAQDDGKKNEDEKKKSEKTKNASDYQETVVVTASRTEQKLDTVPAAVTVISSKDIETSSAENYADVLRNVPGVNVSQMSARDIQVTSRGSTNSLATSQLVLLDNRSLYLDFFGFVMWDFAPIDADQIKQVEVVRGPGSAVWGANAMTGVINIITKAPKENPGTSVILGSGNFNSSTISATHSGVAGKVGYRVSASNSEQDAFERPTGIVPGSDGPDNLGGTPYPNFSNQGTKQPKVNLRLDYDQNDDTTWSFSGGWAGTDGIIHSGIGPFDIESGTSLAYFQTSWKRRAAQVNFSVNSLDGDADNLLTRDPMGNPIEFLFESQSYNLDFSNTSVVGGKHAMTYGANVRQNNFDLSIAPLGEDRQEVGIFFQDEIIFNEKFRWLIGGRVDNLDPIDTVFSPRTSLLWTVKPRHTLRFSYNKAFRAPSMVQNYLDIVIAPAVIDLSALGGPTVFPIVAPAQGNPNLTEEKLDALEVGYVGTFGNSTFTASVYQNETTDSVDFYTEFLGVFSSANPPPGWPLGLNTAFLDNPPLNAIPSFLFTYRNIGEIVDRGVELSFNHQASQEWSWFINYSWQDDPDVTGIPQEPLAADNSITVDAVNQPPTHRVNAGFAYDIKDFFANASVNYQDAAFWTDVLDPSYWGPTDSFTMVNTTVGFRVTEDITISASANNLFDQDVQQHVFGDRIGRRFSGQLKFRFD
jgi:outer membrane receptor protein involved in Fe transport